jgi:hypothetical protein
MSIVKNIPHSAALFGDKLFLEIENNGIYKAVIGNFPFLRIHELKKSFDEGKFAILSKTTSCITIQLAGWLKVELQN